MLSRLRASPGAGKAQPSSPGWRVPGYRCIGGTLYKVSANKLSKTRTPLRSGESPPPDLLDQAGGSLLKGWERPAW